ncbi:hypothetical protein CMEL01_16389 [Colletotrichum melonis]|uniref:Uncharacterized protein n=1 Tax=Colletotrichum melonis TaxID=1209925 RepID=A0AAI9UDS8_9PEZI|nr:hypothetical protein CMEL01_16389 [Colletotrichum melonis]
MFALPTCTPTAIVIIILTDLLPKQPTGIRKRAVSSPSCTNKKTPERTHICNLLFRRTNLHRTQSTPYYTRATNPSTLYENLPHTHYATPVAAPCSSRDIHLAVEGNIVNCTRSGPAKYPDVAAGNARATDIPLDADTRTLHDHVLKSDLRGANDRMII